MFHGRVFFRCVLFVAAAALLLAGRRASGQVLIQRAPEKIPSISQLIPAGWQRGARVQVTLTGDFLEECASVLGPQGVRLVQVLANDAKQLKLELEIAADAPLGIGSFHVLCKAGLSNPRLVRIDDLPQVVEAEENNTQSSATRAFAPATLNGQLTAADQDYFVLEGLPAGNLVFDCEAARLGSPLRPVLTLYDSAGREVARTITPPADIAPDVRLPYICRQPQTHYLRIHDLTYQGADFAAYCVRIGRLPFATSMFPLGGQRGTRVALAVSGGDLAETMVHEVDLTGDELASAKRIEIPTPAGPLAAPCLFAIGEHPEAQEQEPNDTAEQAQTVTTPIALNGRIEHGEDRDTFRFRATAGSPLRLRVLAQQLGSPLDAALTITDSAGVELATMDDREGAPAEAPVVRPLNVIARLDDPLLEFAAPADGEYLVTVSDQFLHGGPAYAWRLEIAPPSQDFELLAQPGVATPLAGAQPQDQQQAQRVAESFAGEGTGALTLDRGGTGAIIVRATRNGYAGPIALSIEDLPPGIETTPATLAEGQNEISLSFTADFEAPHAASFARIVGTGSVLGKEMRRIVQQPVVLSALPINGVVNHNIGRIAVGVSKQGAELAVRGSLGDVLAQASAVPLSVSVRRREGYRGDVSVRLATLPVGMSATSGVVSADANAVELQLSAGVETVIGPHTLLLEGSMAIEGQPQPVLAAYPIVISVLPVATLELAAGQADLTAGGETELTIAVRRNGSAASVVQLEFGGLPRGVSVRTAEIPADASEFKLVLAAAPDAATSAVRRLIQIKPVAIVGESRLELPTLRCALRVRKPM